MSSEATVTIPAGHGRATRLATGQKVKLINTHGSQVVDMWAFTAYDLREHMCMASTRTWNMHLNPMVGDVMVTNQRRPILMFAADTTACIHDSVIAACDRYRYKLLGFEGYHRNCQDNMIEGLQQVGVTSPAPLSNSLNVFMNIPILENGNVLEFRPSVCEPGQYTVFRAEMDCYVVFSACPQDILPIHGEGGAPPKDAHFQVLD